MRFALLLVPLIVLMPRDAFAKRDPRTGFTVEVGAGGGVYRQAVDGSSTTYGALTFPLGVGAFVTPQFAILYRQFAAYGLMGKVPGFTAHGLALQYWPTTSFFVGAAAGFALQFPRGILSGRTGLGENPYGELRVGAMLAARAGYAFVDAPHHSVRLALEVVPIFVRDSNGLAAGLQVEWQYL
jgi:hypothetical protein